MLTGLRTLAKRIRSLDKNVRDNQSNQVRRKVIKSETQNIVDTYFREMRERLILSGIEPDQVYVLDAEMHKLLEISHKHSTVQTYRTIIRKILDDINILEKSTLILESSPTELSLEPVDRLIINTLSKFLPSAARSYEQSIRDLRGSDRLSWRGPATDLRECLREVLDYLAPDSDVLAQNGFKLERDAFKPTMRQKVRYIMSKRGISKSSSSSPESATNAVDEIVGKFIRSVYTRSSVSTHTPTDKNEILRIRDWVRVALCELLEIRADV